MTKEELKEYCEAEFKNISKVADELFPMVSPEKTKYTVAELAAVSAFVVNIYIGIEGILRQMLMFDGLDVTDSPVWHEKVLKKAGEIGILPPDLFQTLSRYLAFRNRFVYSYVFNIKWEELKVLVDAVKDVLARFRAEVEEYIQTI
ncbi:MAG: hypothetical protein HZC11_08825 [Nitrospirae bacterium]|nr:hypothetical protein [Nitrospirota bacterium]